MEFDIIEVDIFSLKIKMMGENKSAKNAEAIERMALMRRGTDANFFTTVPSGKYKDGDIFEQ